MPGGHGRLVSEPGARLAPVNPYQPLPTPTNPYSADSAVRPTIRSDVGVGGVGPAAQPAKPSHAQPGPCQRARPPPAATHACVRVRDPFCSVL